MATVTRQAEGGIRPTVLRGVSFREYTRLTRLDANRHLRMAYFDGTLEIMSPRLRNHEGPSRRIDFLIQTIADGLEIPHAVAGSYTFRRAGAGPRGGTGREPDQSYYFQSVDRFPRDRDPDLDAGDPPPDLWVEVDNYSSSRSRLPVDARLGVPEVWRYVVARKSLRFWELVDGKYVATKRSLALPVLTPERVMEAIGPGLAMADTEFLTFLDGWVPALIARLAADAEPRAD